MKKEFSAIIMITVTTKMLLASIQPPYRTFTTLDRPSSEMIDYRQIKMSMVGVGFELISSNTQKIAINLPMEIQNDLDKLIDAIEDLNYQIRSQDSSCNINDELEKISKKLNEIVLASQELGFRVRDHLMSFEQEFSRIKDQNSLTSFLVKIYLSDRTFLRTQAGETGDESRLKNWELENQPFIEQMKLIKPLLPQYDQHLRTLVSAIQPFLVLLAENLPKEMTDTYLRTRYCLQSQAECRNTREIPSPSLSYDRVELMLAVQSEKVDHILMSILTVTKKAGLVGLYEIAEPFIWSETMSRAGDLHKSWKALLLTLEEKNIHHFPSN